MPWDTTFLEIDLIKNGKKKNLNNFQILTYVSALAEEKNEII